MRKVGGGGRGFSVVEARGSSLLDCAGGIEGGAAILGDCGRGSPAIPSVSLLGSWFSGGGGSCFSESGFTIEGSRGGD